MGQGERRSRGPTRTQIGLSSQPHARCFVGIHRYPDGGVGWGGGVRERQKALSCRYRQSLVAKSDRSLR